MASVGVFLSICCIISTATCSQIPDFSHPKVDVSLDLLKKMLQHMTVVENPFGPFKDDTMKKISSSYKINKTNYNNQDAVDKFQAAYDGNVFLPKNTTFAILHREHTQQLKLVYGLLFNAKDWDTFINTAVWLRDHINTGLFLCAYTAACIHREDTIDGLFTFSPYEVVTNLFVTKPVIDDGKSQSSDCDGEVIIPMKYSDQSQNIDYKVAYYTEDIGLGAFAMMWHFWNPFWMSEDLRTTKADRQGEGFYYTHNYILKRYLMAKMNEGLDDKDCKLNDQLPGYNPNMCYRDGTIMPPRNDSVKLDNVQDWDLSRRLTDKLRKITDSSKYGSTSLDNLEGCNVIGDLMEGFGNKLSSSDNSRRKRSPPPGKGPPKPDKGPPKPDKPDKGPPKPDKEGPLGKTSDSDEASPEVSLFYLYIWMIGHYSNDQETYPALDHFPTMVKDPAFYCVLKDFMSMMQKHKEKLKDYKREDLTFDVVKLVDVKVSPLATYMEDFDISMDSVVDASDKCQMKARVKRLNHDDFTTTITADSPAGGWGMVRVFIAPAEDSKGKKLEQERAAGYATEIDVFPYNFKAGANVIVRKSTDSTVTYSEFDGVKSLMASISGKIKEKQNNKDDDNGDPPGINTVRQCGFPHRHLLPKGKASGRKVYIFVMVSAFDSSYLQSNEDVKKFDGFVTCGARPGQKYPDDAAMGYPFDRKIKKDMFALDNMNTQTTVILHRD